jgi:hypothetical protein
MNKEKLIKYINSHDWWRTALPDREAIKARGLFLISSFKQAEFYGRPIDTPFRVKVSNPLFGDETYIMQALDLPPSDPDSSIEERFLLDAEMMRLSIAKGYDAIALFTTKGYEKFINSNKIPGSTELQVFSI